MGACGSTNKKKSKLKVFNEKLNINTEVFEIPQLNEIFKPALDNLNNIEELREKFIPEWYKFLESSGAIVLKSPSIKSCMIGYCYIMSYELSTNMIEKMKIVNDSPWMSFESDIFTKDSKIYMKQLDDFLNYVTSIKDKTESTYITFKIQYENAKREGDGFDMNKLDESQKQNASNQISNATSKLEMAMETITYIRNIVTKKDGDLLSIKSELEIKENFEEVKMVGEKYKNKKLDPIDIMWKHSKEPKIDSINEVKYLQSLVKPRI